MEYSFYCGGSGGGGGGGLAPQAPYRVFFIVSYRTTRGDRSRQVAKYEIPIMPCAPIFISRSVTSCRQVDRAPGGNIGDQSLMGIPYLSACQPVPRVDRSICKYIGVLVLMGILFGTFHLSTCQLIKLPTRVDRWKYIGGLGLMDIPYLPTCQPVPGLTGPEVNI